MKMREILVKNKNNGSMRKISVGFYYRDGGLPAIKYLNNRLRQDEEFVKTII